MNRRFNVRVYGIWVHEGRLLVNEEQIRGRVVVKLPGGGLEWGEGTRDCLVREWKEELGLDVTVTEHFYTTDFFQHSAFDDSQVISIYYRVMANAVRPIVNHVPGERTYWLPLGEVGEHTFTLPIDKIVGGMIAAAGRVPL
ncbi:hypothetical protein GCM10023093_18420 [Nemorincola caseinilytica]|uniref:Nudix hydrolase domain-containing protein n=1 Tax=Nemorincola caseinilytica TaxID=2054315 RepID=A0ABP8NHU8_9BACT